MKSNSRPIEDCLLQDHKEIKELYNSYRSAISYEDKQRYFNQIGWEIARHTVAEEIVVYPCVRDRIPDGNLLADDALDDDRKTKQSLSNLNSMNINSVDFAEKFRSFMVDIYTHVEKEEKIHIPKLIETLSIEERINLGEKFENRKLIAPTRPHPWTSDKYPFLETLQGVLLAPIDKFIDLFKSFPKEPYKTSTTGIGASSYTTDTTGKTDTTTTYTTTKNKL